MSAYLSLLVVLLVWAFIALRAEQNLRKYALIYGVNILVANVSQWLFGTLLQYYTFGSRTNFYIVTVGIEPLLGVLYGHYSSIWPVTRAVGWAAFLGLVLEQVYLWSGAFRYLREWHPFITMVFFAGYFLWTRWLTRVAARLTGESPDSTLPGGSGRKHVDP